MGGTLLLLAVVTPASAQFFNIVYDPTNYANAVLRYLQLQSQYAQLIQTYQLMVQQARQLGGMSERYRSVSRPWQPLSADHTYDTTAAWIDSVNTGLGMLRSYKLATEPLQDYGDAITRLPPDQFSRTRTHYDRLQLTDAALVHALQAVGSLRNQEPSVEAAVENLEDDAYDGEASLNTQIAVLNKINATSIAGVRLAKDANSLLIAVAEQQLLDATDRRDGAVQAVNAQIAFLRDAPDLYAQTTAQTTDALTTFRIP